MINKINEDYLEYLEKNKDNLDYLIIDPPWHYGMVGSKLQDNTANATNFSYWGKDNKAELLKVLELLKNSNIRAIAVWTTLPMLEATLRAAFESSHPYNFRSMITWVKRYKSGKAASVMAHYFLNTTEYLVILKHKNPADKIPRTKIRTHWESVRGKRTIKPKEVESKLINSWPGKWAYIFSGPYADKLELSADIEIDCVDICLSPDER